MKRLLGFDLGEKRIGLAISDELGITAQRLPALENKSEKETLAYIQELIRQYGITALVVGLPKHMNGTIGEKARDALKFVKRLEKAFGLPVVTWDERLTTRYAERTFKEMGLKRKRRRQIIDSVSSQLILQSYLDSQK